MPQIGAMNVIGIYRGMILHITAEFVIMTDAKLVTLGFLIMS